jgi:signal transduction histidine kinase
VANHRAYIAAVEERARRAENSREEEAHRRVIEERMRIARELHDVVAHHIAVVNVQAGVAAHLIHRDPTAAAHALSHVRAASRSVLSELSTLLGVLRAAGDTDAPTEPAPGLQRLDTLLESLRRSGLSVTASCHGDRRPLPAGIDLAGYRIVQEALTNVQKHGDGGAAVVELGYDPHHLTIRIRNNAGTGRPRRHEGNGTGHGILGMRERVAALGGTFAAGPQASGGFAVYAKLPLPVEVYQ